MVAGYSRRHARSGGAMVVRVTLDLGRCVSRGKFAKGAEDGVELAVHCGVIASGEHAMSLAECFGGVAKVWEAVGDGDGSGAEVAEVAAEKNVAVAIVGVAAKVASEMGRVSVEGRAAGVA